MEMIISPALIRMRLKYNHVLYVSEAGWSKFKIEFLCMKCKQWIKPEKIIIGRHHIKATHCGQEQEVAVTA